MERYPFPLLAAGLLAFGLAWPGEGIAQQVTFSNPPGFNVCDSAFFTVQIHNDSSALLENVQLTVSLANCLQYLPGSASGAVEVAPPDLQHPVFLLPPIEPFQTASVQIGLFAPCSCYDQINAGTLFANQVQLIAWGDTLQLSAGTFPLETAQLVITQLSNAFLSGKKGELLSRNFTIQNSRPGALSSFLFEDLHQGGFALSSPQGIVEANQPGYFALRLGAADFQLIGDGDEFFEQGESITITENILISSCGFNQPSSLSQILVSWGCENQSCQSAAQTALVQFLPAGLQAQLEVLPSIQAPLSLCAETGIPQSLTLVNTGDEPAFDLFFTVRQERPGSGVDPLSATATINGSPATINAQGGATVLFPAPCLNTGPFRESLFVECPDLQPGDTLVLQWDAWFCEPECGQGINQWSYEYRFQKSCPPNPLVASDTFQVQFQHPALSAQLSGDFLMADGDTHTFSYAIQYDSLSLLSGQMEVALSLPCGLVWENSDLALGGVLPDAVNLESADSLQFITAIYTLPLPANAVSLQFDLSFFCDSLCQQEFICVDSLLSSCLDYQCSETPGPSLPLEIQTSLLSCGPQACQSVSVFFICEPDSICLDTIAGYVRSDMEFQRISLGLPDNDNDRWPDGPGFDNPALLRLDRSMPGDTIRTLLSGMAIADQPGASFDFLSAKIAFQPVGADPVLNAALYDPLGIPALSAKLDIWDASAGQVYSCPDVGFFAETTANELIYTYAIDPASLAASGCNLPPGFAWEHGDSLQLTALHRLDANPVKQNPTAPTPPVFTVTIRSSVETEQDFSCGCNQANWQISGYEYLLLPGSYAIPFCDTSAYQGSTFFKLELGQGNFFPYEYRPLGAVPQLSIELPPGVHLAESRIGQFTLQNGPNWVGPTPITGMQNGQYWSFDLTPFQDTLADEGFFFLFQYRFTADCTEEGVLPLVATAVVVLQSDTLAVEAQDNALKLLLPGLQLTNPLPNQIALDNKGRWNFTLFNQINSISGQQSGSAYHIWLEAFSPSGLLSDFLLVDTQSGEVLPPINGVFQLDSLQAGQTRFFQIQALNQSCEEETLEIRYGFGCEVGVDCQEYIQSWSVVAPQGGLDFSLANPPTDSCALLCDTIPYHTITVYNTNLGPVCDAYVEIVLPQGLSVVPGSCGLAYPPGAPFAVVADPFQVSPGVFRWNLSDLNPDLAADCLPGLGAAPLHQVSLRFWTESDCSFPVNSSILFRTGGLRNCGLPVNTTARPGGPICIQLPGADIETFFQAGLNDTIACQDTALFNLAFVHTAASLSTDTLSLLLPPGVDYVPGSIIPVANPPTADPLIDSINGQLRLNWAFPPGLAPSSLVAFRFLLHGFSNLPCGESYFWLSAGIQSETVCAATGDTCSVRVETGTRYIPFEIQRPVYQIGQFQAQWKNDTLHGQITVLNLNNIPGPPPIIDLYLDQNGDGQGDSLLLSLDSLAFSIPLTLSQACQLLAVIDSSYQCLCASASRPIDQPLFFADTIQNTICSGEEISLGFCIPDWTAQWEPSTSLSCVDCCETGFLAFNPGVDILDFSHELLLEDGQGCALLVAHQTGVRPEPGIAYADPVACAGEGRNLIAEPGIAFLWEGPGIGQGQNQAISVFPDQSAVYTLVMTDLFGCTGQDSVFLEVWPLPIADAGEDLVFCPGAPYQLQAFEGPGYQYTWSPAGVFADPGAFNPVFTDTISGQYTLEVVGENGCKALDSVEVYFGQGAEIQLPVGTVVCAGDSLWVAATGEYVGIVWSPDDFLECLNPPLCDTILLYPQASFTLTATASSLDGCTAGVSMEIVVANEAQFTADTLFTCANEPVWIGDMLIAEAGLFCDTLLLPSGCLQIHCTQLMVGDTSSLALAETICPGDSLALAGQWFYEPGQYALPLSSAEGCDSLVLLDLSWWELPGFSMLPSDTSLFEGESVEIVVIGAGAVAYLWTPAEGLDCDTCAGIVAAPEVSTTYQAAIWDENGCRQTLQSQVEVRIDCDPQRIQIPSAFTPDGDGVNDTFGVLTRAGRELVLEMQVWNRWGQRVFDSREAQARWDGGGAPSDVYVYRIAVGCPDGAQAVYTGEISLLR